MKTIVAAIAMLSPVAATAQLPAEPGAAVTAPVPGGGPSAKSKPTRYCVVRSETGTRIPRKTCHTRDEWLAYGYDPLADVK